MPHFETSRAVLQTWRAVYVRLLRQNHLSPTGLTINFLAYKYQAAAEENSLIIEKDDVSSESSRRRHISFCLNDIEKMIIFYK
jgi:hypothetical protein